MKLGTMLTLNNRQFTTLALFMTCTILFISPMSLAGVTEWDFDGWTFYSGTGSNSGAITFLSAFETSKLYWDNGYVCFEDFDMGYSWDDLGFQCPLDATLLIRSVAEEEIVIDVTPVGTQTFKIFIGEADVPATVETTNNKLTTWTYSSVDKAVVMVVHGIDRLTINWNVENPPPLGQTYPTPVQYFLSGNLIGFIESIYINLVGYTFYLVPLLGVGIVVWIRTQSAMFVAFLWVASGAGLWSILPPEGKMLGFWFMVIGTTVAIFSAWFGRKSY